jgi:hypothetical protein
MARVDEVQPTAQPSSVPPTELSPPPVEVIVPNLSGVSAATFRRGSLSRHRVHVALGLLLGVAAVTTLLVLFADLIFAHLGTIVSWVLIIVVAVSMIGLVLLLRDEQRARRTARHEPSDADA